MGNSWLAPDDTACLPNPDQFDISTVDQALIAEIESTANCGQITDINGAFQPCVGVVDPLNYFDACVYDMAAVNGEHQMLCNDMEAYADACAAAGVVIVGWRDEALCPTTTQCPPHSHYLQSTSACQDSCRTPTASSTCGRPNVEGCECDPGYIWSGMTCVEPKDCGCLHEMNYYALGEHWGTSDGQQCECLPNFQVSCAPMSCLPGAEWSLQDGVYGCHQVPTLKPTTTTTPTPKPTTKPTTTPTPRPTTTTTQTPKPTTTPAVDDMPQTFDIEDNCIGHVTCPAKRQE
ncbi:zonadhesin-like [Branchiostoma floridae x Branchiostoma belcheri]